MDDLRTIFVSWFPMVILIIVWIIFMKKQMKEPQNQAITYVKRQNELLEQFVGIAERMASSLEVIAEDKKKNSP